MTLLRRGSLRRKARTQLGHLFSPVAFGCHPPQIIVSRFEVSHGAIKRSRAPQNKPKKPNEINVNLKGLKGL